MPLRTSNLIIGVGFNPLDFLITNVTVKPTAVSLKVPAAITITEISQTAYSSNLVCRSSGETLSREQFEKRLAAVIAYLYPTYQPYVLASEGSRPTDPLQKELALRERSNRVGIVAVSEV